MTASERSHLAFKTIAVTAIVSAATNLALLSPLISSRLANAADRLVTSAQAGRNDASLATLQLEAASWLRLQHRATLQTLTDHYLALGQLDQATATLNRLPAGEGVEQIGAILLRQQRFEAVRRSLRPYANILETASGQALMAKSWLEEGSYREATKAAQAAYSYSNDRPYMELYALALLLAGREGEYSELVTIQSSPEAVETLKGLKASNMAAARLAYAHGLLVRSEHLLQSELGATNEAASLLAEIRLSAPGTSRAQLEDARQQLQTAIDREPAVPKLYELLIKINDRLGDRGAVNTVTERLKRLNPEY